MGKGILLLNATYEPLAVVSLRRAVVLLLDERAVIVEEGSGEIRSARAAMPNPSVIRLTTYVKVPYRAKIPLTRSALLARDNRTCQYCNRPGDTIDHVLPRARGGKHEWENVVIACYPCNNKKSDKLLSSLGWKLNRKPVAPMGTRWVYIALARKDPAWEPYLAPQPLPV